MRSITNEKFEKLLKFMQDEKIDVLMIADNESSKMLTYNISVVILWMHYLL